MMIVLTILGAAILLPLLVPHVIVSLYLFDFFGGAGEFQVPVSLFWNDETPTLLTSTHGTRRDPGSLPATRWEALNLDSTEGDGVIAALPGIESETLPPDAVFRAGGSVFLAFAGMLRSGDGEREFALPESSFVLAVCADADFAWLLLKDPEGLKLARFDGERLTTPVLVGAAAQSPWRGEHRHHAALLPAAGGWVIVSGSDSAARYKYLPPDRGAFWASIPWRAAPFERSVWIGYTHRGKPRILATNLRQMLNIPRFFFQMGNPQLNAEVYGFNNGVWRRLRTIPRPLAGQILAATDRRPLPGLLVASAMENNGVWSLRRFVAEDAREDPWKKLPHTLGHARELPDYGPWMNPGRLNLMALALMFASVIVLDRLMRRWRRGLFVAPNGKHVTLAPLWRRGTARAVDLSVVFLPTFGLVILILPFWQDTSTMGDVEGFRRLLAVGLVLIMGLLLLPLVVWSLLESRTGQTPGKWLLRIRVLDSDALQPPSLEKALVRNLLLAVEAATLGMASLVSIPISRTQGRLGDLGAGTIVVMDDRESVR